MSPYFMRWSHAFLALGIQFAGGVFMSTALLHFLHDSNKTFLELSSSSYPIAFMLAVCGYLLTQVGDQTAKSIEGKRKRRVQLSSSSFEYLKEGQVDDELKSAEGCKPNAESLKSASADDDLKSAEGCKPNGESLERESVSAKEFRADAYVDLQIIGKGENCAANVPPGATCVGPASSRADLETGGKNVNAVAEKQATGVESSNGNIADAILLVLALCFHSVFEGLAIGIADTSYHAWRNMWTVMLHKVLAAIAMSMALLTILPNRPFLSVVTYSFGFAISSPIGIVIGIIIDAVISERAANWTYAITMGVASGVFLFVAINHLLNKGYAAPEKLTVDTPFWKTMAVIAGASLIFGAMYFDG
ncbi:unnamed protein product [Calypogeia fissa]